jgi:hypothetical protein
MIVAYYSLSANSFIKPLKSAVTAMTQPPLYKYLDVEGARKTLGKRCFRHAKASTFNDTKDLTVGSIFPEDNETACQLIEDGLVDCPPAMSIVSRPVGPA